MMRYILVAWCYLAGTLAALGQPPRQQIFHSDISNFWQAYDSIRTTTDSLTQLQYINQLYIDRGTPGLKAFMDVRSYTAGEWVSLIRRYPKFWNSIRPATQQAQASAQGFDLYLKKLKRLYPALRPASIYFTIGALRSGGTYKDNMVLIGAELAMGSTVVDVSEFPAARRAFLTRLYSAEPIRHVIPLNVHEYVHTQQQGESNTLLGLALLEGSCDLVAELVTKTPMPHPYVTYGRKHESELKEQFKTEMFSANTNNWFYNQTSEDPNHVPDLGYYMGYAISKAYYQRAGNRKQAIKELIELNYSDNEAVEALLRKSGYYPEPLNKAQLLEAYENTRPVVTNISPAISGEGWLDASVQEIKVEFSTAMSPYTGTGYGTGGKEQFPVVGRAGFSADKKSYTYKVSLQPGRTYSFVLEAGGFSAADGRPLKPYEVKFRTRP
jgi:hypothetical protein